MPWLLLLATLADVPRIKPLFAVATALLGIAATLPPPGPHGAAVRVRFDAGRVRSVEARGAGADDPVRVASISKLITTLGLMRLVEAGTLDLDADVSRWLGFRLRNPAFPDVPITLRLLLSHRSSLQDGIDYALPLGTTLEQALADPRAWDAEHPPGSFFRYANIGFPVVATAMEGATGARFDILMERLLFRPLAIDGCFNWTRCSDAAIARAVVLRGADGRVRRDDLGGKRPACPVVPAADGSCDLAAYRPGTNGALFSPQGGARLSARGLARIGQLLLRRGERLLTPESIARIVDPVWTFSGDNGATEGGFYCRYGLSVQHLATRAVGCADDPFQDGRQRVGHAGEAYGLRSGLWIDRARGRGIAYFVTAIDDGAPRGRSAFTAAEEAIAR